MVGVRGVVEVRGRAETERMMEFLCRVDGESMERGGVEAGWVRAATASISDTSLQALRVRRASTTSPDSCLLRSNGLKVVEEEACVERLPI